MAPILTDPTLSPHRLSPHDKSVWAAKLMSVPRGPCTHRPTRDSIYNHGFAGRSVILLSRCVIQSERILQSHRRWLARELSSWEESRPWPSKVSPISSLIAIAFQISTIIRCASKTNWIFYLFQPLSVFYLSPSPKIPQRHVYLMEHLFTALLCKINAVNDI